MNFAIGWISGSSLSIWLLHIIMGHAVSLCLLCNLQWIRMGRISGTFYFRYPDANLNPGLAEYPAKWLIGRMLEEHLRNGRIIFSFFFISFVICCETVLRQVNTFYLAGYPANFISGPSLHRIDWNSGPVPSRVFCAWIFNSGFGPLFFRSLSR